MMVFSILLIGVGLGAFCLLLWNFAVYMFPAYIGLSAGLWALDTGGGIGSLFVGLFAGVMTFLLGQVVFSWSRSLLMRWLVILVFAGPATIAGYSLVFQLAELGIMPSPIWQQIFAVISAAAVGGTTIARLAAFPLPRPERQPRALVPARPRPTGLQKSMLIPE